MKELRKFVAVALALAFLPAYAAAQDGATISGRVTTDSGDPLAGASVFLDALRLGATTDASGQYSFSVPSARVSGQTLTLTARRIGYTVRVAQVTLSAANITQNFVLPANPLRLGEVVVTGAGTTTTREKLGIAINSVDSTLIRRSNESNLVNALAGKAPNVEISSQSGEPGASSFIRIRGPKTIQGSGQPLFIVDGVPIDNSTNSTGSFLASTVSPNRASDVNPADIETVSILKGAAAAAIYGARAAQGVVLITTKSGRAGRTRYSLRTTISKDEVTKGIPLQQKFGQGYLLDADFNDISCGPSSTPCPEGAVNFGGVSPKGAIAGCTAAGCRPQPFSYGPEFTDKAFYPDGPPQFYDQFGSLFRDGSSTDNTMTVSGGSDRTTFYLSLGRLDQTGTIIGPNNSYDRTTLRMKAQHSLTDRIRFGGNLAYVDARGAFIQKGSNLSGLLLGGARTPPEFDNRKYLDSATGLHRSYRYPRPNVRNATRGYDNPFWVINEHRNNSKLGRAYGSANFEYDPVDWLQIRYALGGDYNNDERLEALPPSSSDFPTGRMNVTNFVNYQVDHNLLAIGRWDSNPNFGGTLTLGQNLNSRKYRQLYVTGENWISPAGPFILNNTVVQRPNEFESLIHTESYFGQATVDLFSQLFFTTSLRNDGFSTFAQSDRRHWFPKVSAAWNFTGRSGQGSRVPFLDFGKLRLAWGQAGREPGVYQTITAFSLANIGEGWGPFLRPVIGGQGGVRSSTVLGQENIKPERTTELEGGLDIGFLRNRADFGVTFYNAESNDVIFLTPLAPSTGYEVQARNAAVITNKGVEMTLNLRPITTRNFAWDIGANWGRNRNKVVELEGVDYVDVAGAFAGAPTSVVAGEQVGVLRGNDFVRCGRKLNIGGRDIDALCGGAAPGALFIDDSGFPIHDPTSRVLMNSNPDWTAGLRSSATLWRRVQVSALLDFKQGGDVWNGTRGALTFFGTHKDTEIRGQQRTFGKDFYVQQVGGPGAGKAVTIDEVWFTDLGSGFGPVASSFIEDGSYVKLREVSVGLTLDQPWVGRLASLSSIELRLSGRNLKTWTDYTGIDPETNLGGAEVQSRGIDYFNNPQTRSIVLTVGLNR